MESFNWGVWNQLRGHNVTPYSPLYIEHSLRLTQTHIRDLWYLSKFLSVSLSNSLFSFRYLFCIFLSFLSVFIYFLEVFLYLIFRSEIRSTQKFIRDKLVVVRDSVKNNFLSLEKSTLTKLPLRTKFFFVNKGKGTVTSKSGNF